VGKKGAGRKSAEFWESVELYRLIVESARDFAIFTIDLKNKITSWNRGAKRILGFSETQAIGMSGEEIFTPEDRAKNDPEKEIATARRRGRAEDERWHLRKDRSRFWGSGLMMPLLSDDGQIAGYVKILRDLTDRKAAQDDLMALNRTLEERVRQRAAELEQSHRELAEAARQLARIERIERERIAADLHDNVGQMLAFAQMKVAGISGSVAIDDEVAATAREIREYLDEAVRYTRALMSSLSPPGLAYGELIAALRWLASDMSKHGLKVSFTDDGKPKPVSSDAQATLFQAVRELLYNVRKHSGVQKARVRVARRQKTVTVEVVDEGVGFKKNAIADTPCAASQKGFGLFNIVRRLKLFGGDLEVDRKRKRGARIIVTVPIEQ
jgi:PAS domain S-box-containing protein